MLSKFILIQIYINPAIIRATSTTNLYFQLQIDRFSYLEMTGPIFLEMTGSISNFKSLFFKLEYFKNMIYEILLYLFLFKYKYKIILNK